MTKGIVTRRVAGPALSDVQPVFRSALSQFGADAQLNAAWRFPETPVIVVSINDVALAAIDYSEASATAHWSLSWIQPQLAGAFPPVGLTILASQVPDDADVDEALREYMLDVALQAVMAQLTHKSVPPARRS
jgi:hypothetical protein